MFCQGLHVCDFDILASLFSTCISHVAIIQFTTVMPLGTSDGCGWPLRAVVTIGAGHLGHGSVTVITYKAKKTSTKSPFLKSSQDDLERFQQLLNTYQPDRWFHCGTLQGSSSRSDTGSLSTSCWHPDTWSQRDTGDSRQCWQPSGCPYNQQA